MKLKELGEYFIGLTYKPENVSDNGVIVLRSGNIQDGQFDLSDIVRVDAVIRDKQYVKSGDILMCSRNGSARLVGKSTVIPDIEEPMTFGAFMTIFRTPYNKYLRFFLQSNSFRNQLAGSKTTTINQITIRMLDDIDIDLPGSIEREDRIKKLESLNRIIALRKQELLKLDEFIKARFVEMFGDPIINERGWQQISLLDSLETGRTVSYGIVQTGEDYENGTPVFRPIDIAGGHIPKREELKKTDPLISAQYKRTLLKGNELLITVRGSVGETFQATEEFEGCNVGRNIVPLVTDSSKVLQRFLQELFAQDAIKNWLKGITKGIALQGLNMGEFKEMPVIMPPMNKQKAFVDFALQVDKSKVAVQAALDKAQLLFDSLMQQYFG